MSVLAVADSENRTAARVTQADKSTNTDSLSTAQITPATYH